MALPQRLIAPVCALLLGLSSLGATPVRLSVAADGALPGFREGTSIPFMTARMNEAGLPGWTFAPAAPHTPQPDRLEWWFELYPYAGGAVRQFIPIPGVQRMFGVQHLLTARVLLFLDGQYQTLVYGQALVHGGPQDKALADFITGLTGQLLGDKGAYRAIDMTPAKHP